MKTTEKEIQNIVGPTRELRLGHPAVPLLPARDKLSLSQWTTGQQIQEVSKKLARINQVAIRLEAEGDYFKSGDLSHQIQEIIRGTAELFKKSQRAKS